MREFKIIRRTLSFCGLKVLTGGYTNICSERLNYECKYQPD
uniref:Uncharacterized protein n=1 Tax=Rhizophora mucronata TaxID=61149 RepID=A0A2P2MS01_RHIMU